MVKETARRLGREELQRLLLGASVLGTGGGGSFSLGRAMVEDLAMRGMRVDMVDAKNLDPDALGVSTAILGGGLTHEELEGMGMISDAPASLQGARELETFLGRPIDFVFSAEIGPQNTLEAVRLAAFLGVPLVDGDCAGRALPEMQQSTLTLFGIPLAPYVVSTFQGDVAILSKVSSEMRTEKLCRALASCSGGVVCLTGFPVRWERLKPALLPGTLTRCMEIGACLGPGRRPADQIAKGGDGRIAFRGLVRRFEVSCQGAFFRGVLDLEGTDAFAGRNYRVGIQNEFLWSWLDGVPDIQCPDLICVLDSDSGLGKVTYGHGFENAIEPGEDLTVLHFPSDPVWRSERGLALFPASPAYLTM